MEEPLPPGWRVVWSETYQTQYWFHAERQESSWLRPYLDRSGREAFAEADDGNGNGNGPGTQEVPSPEPSPLSGGGGSFGGAQSPQCAPHVGGASGAGGRGFGGHGGTGGGGGGQPDAAALAEALADAQNEEANLLVALSGLKQRLRATVRERERLARALAAAQARQAMNPAQENEHGHQVATVYILMGVHAAGRRVHVA